MDTIIQRENKILREKAQEVEAEQIKSRKTQTIIRRMQKALDREEDGIAIAAPQIGESLRIFVVSKKVFEIMKTSKEKNKVSEQSILNESESPTREAEKPNDLVFINPTIVKVSKEKVVAEEGCLSVRWLYGLVKRARKVSVRAYDKGGKPFTFGGSGLMAQIFQHEIDHLNGILFTDKARGLKEMSPSTQNTKT